MRKQLQSYLQNNSTNNLLIIAGATLILLAIPFTVFFANTQQQLVNQPKAATTPLTPCSTNCGSPRFFCDDWPPPDSVSAGPGFCDDYRDLYCPTSDATLFLSQCPFPGTVRNDVTTNVLSSTDPDYTTHMDGAPTISGFFFNQQEHFHTEVIDGNFGMALVRQHQPFDFANRTGHLHVDVDLKVSMRRYVRFILSPELTKTTVDDRQGFPRPANALDIWYRDATLVGNLYKNAGPICVGGCGNAFDVKTNYYGVDNVRDHLDFYISRTHIKITINGTTQVDQDIPDIGFDRAYVYLDQASYNPCKDLTAPNWPNGQCTENYQIFHWDNLAFDGPKLANNSLTPIGSRDIVFNAGWTNSCTFKGQPANLVGPAGTGDGRWATYVIRVPDDGSSASVSDVTCSWVNNVNHGIYDFEIVKQGNSSTTPPPPPPTSPPPTTPPPPPPPPPATSGQVIQITSPANGATVSGTVRLNSQTVNNSGVSTVNYLIDGVSIGTDSTSPFFVDWDSTKVTNGSHVVTVRPVNVTGNDEVITVTVSNGTTAKIGDINGDGKVNIIDISSIIDKWGATNKPPEDVNQDGKVDIQDISIAIDHWG